MRRMINRRLRAGFTLVELMVAVALGTIILAVVVTVFAQGSRVSTLMHARSEAMHNAWVALDMLENDLQYACINPDGTILLGVYSNPPDPLSRGGVDRSRGGAPTGVFSNVAPNQRHGVEFLTTYGTLSAEGAAHVLYYVAPQGTTPPPHNTVVGQLIRYAQPCGSNVIAPFIGATLSGGAGNTEDEQAIASGITQFRLRYFCRVVPPPNRQWFDPAASEGWDSTAPNGWDATSETPDDLQYRRMPDVIEVTLTIVDSDWVLDKEEMPIEIHRLIMLPED